MGKFSEDIALAVRELMKDPVFLTRANYPMAGKILWVKKSTSTGYTDFAKARPDYEDGIAAVYTTVTAAVAAAVDYDVIMITDGIYDESTFPLVITQTALKIIGSGTSGYNWGPCALKSSASADTIMEVDANGVEISGLGFNCYTNAKSGIVLGASQSIYKTHIHDCFFGCASGGNAEGEIGISIGCDETGAQVQDYDAVDTHVERCGFHYLATSAIQVYGTRTKINDCLIFSNSDGINFTATGGNRAVNTAINNYLIGRGNAGTGIKIASTEPTNGTLLIANNVVTHFGTINITQDKSNEGIVNNGTQGNGAATIIVDAQAA